MSVQYKISPELGIAFMFCKGGVSEVDYFSALENMSKHKSYTVGMCQIIDFFSAHENISLEGMHSAIHYREEMEGDGVKFEHVILLTYSKGIDLFVKAMKILTKKDNMELDAVSTLDEAISLLGFQEKEQEIIDFYTHSKQQIEQSSKTSP